MYVELTKNNGIPYLRLVKGIRRPNAKGVMTVTKKTIYNIGPLSRYDDGKPDYVQRLKESYKNGTPLIPELLPYVEEKPELEKKYMIEITAGGKYKVLITYVEAGMGHITPMAGMAKAFSLKYGDKCDVKESYVFKDSKEKKVRKMGDTQVKFIKLLSKSWLYRKIEGFSYRFSSRFTLKIIDFFLVIKLDKSL